MSTSALILIITITVLALLCLVWMTLEAVRGREAPSSNRRIIPTYGAGYEHEFRAWQEDWEWVTLREYVRDKAAQTAKGMDRMVDAMSELQRVSERGTNAMNSLARAIDSFQADNNGHKP